MSKLITVKPNICTTQYNFGHYLLDESKFCDLEILQLPSQYTLSLLLFMTENRNQFKVNSETDDIDTRQHNFHQHSVNLTTRRECTI
jgi:hypothetical protein